MRRTLLAGLIVFGWGTLGSPAGEYSPGKLVIVPPADADPLVTLAASELRHYAYLRTGMLPPVRGMIPAHEPSITLLNGPGENLPVGGPDPNQNHAIYVASRSPLKIVVHGASPAATLWAAYALIESWGLGFYLGGDAVPKRDPNFTVEPIQATYAPVLAIRGNLPWFNFLNSPTTWNPQDYKTFFSQMAKQKANFIGFHAYDHEPFGGYNITRAKAKMGGPLMTTISAHRWWSPHAMSTKDFLFGTDLFFDRGEWGCEVGIEDAWTFAPGRTVRLQQQMMADALAYARRRAIRTCLGWEVRGNPEDPNVRAAFRQRLRHTLATYPLDYVWIWQSEGRGTGGRPEGTGVDPDIAQAFAYLGPKRDLSEAARITKFVRLAHETLHELAPQVRLIVSGWGGDQWMRFTTLYEGLDQVVPPDVIFAALDNIDPRLADQVSEVYAKVSPQRERWPIPWFESDGGHTRVDQTGPQTNVTAFEPLLQDIVRKGCQGALGIHWRTRNVEDVAGYLYRFGWNPDLTAAEFFRRYAEDHYSPKDAEHMAQVHLRLEELGPQYVGAAGCIECSTPFTWFFEPRGPHAGHKPNVAGHLPDAERVPELRALAKDLLERSERAAADGRHHEAKQYRDLAQTIRWLLARARVGWEIWNSAAPLEQRLRDAERLVEPGRVDQARAAARRLLADLEALDFREGLEALASTCRTRGELGMLATANSRYGRFYATFVQRVAQILGEPLPQARGAGRWTGPEVLTVFPVPNRVAANETVHFDAVLLPADRATAFHVKLVGLTPSAPDVSLLLARLGGAYYRVVFHPPGEGVWAWSLTPNGAYQRPSGAIPLPEGMLTIGPPVGPVEPSYRPPPRRVQQEPVLKIDFDQPLREYGDVVGNAKRTAGVRGQALDTRAGGFLRLTDASAAVAFGGPFSIVFFARPEPWDADPQMPVLLSKGTWMGDGYFIQLYRGKVRVGLGEQRSLDAATLEPGRWTHVAVAYDGAEARLYLDAEPAGDRALDGLLPSELPLRIGAYREPGQPEHFPFRGCLDELAFYNRALRLEEIQSLAGK